MITNKEEIFKDALSTGYICMGHLYLVLGEHQEYASLLDILWEETGLSKKENNLIPLRAFESRELDSRVTMWMYLLMRWCHMNRRMFGNLHKHVPNLPMYREEEGEWVKNKGGKTTEDYINLIEFEKYVQDFIKNKSLNEIFSLPDELNASKPKTSSEEDKIRATSQEVIKEDYPLNYEQFIRRTLFKRKDDTVFVTFPEKRTARAFSKEALGFGRSTVTWEDFLAILGLGFYKIPLIPKKGGGNRREYDKRRGRLGIISRNLVSFLNKECNLKIPKDFFLFEPQVEEKYIPKFQTDEKILKDLLSNRNKDDTPSEYGESPFGHKIQYDPYENDKSDPRE